MVHPRPTLLSILATGLVVATAAPRSAADEGGAAPQGRPPLAARHAGDLLTDRVLVKVAARASARPRIEGTKTGVADLDRLLADLHATAVRPVFKSPPRGRALPAAAERIGIDRWIRVDFGRDRSDWNEIVARLKALRSVEIAEGDRVILPTLVPSDPDYAPLQWDLKPDRTDAEGAWDRAHDSTGFTIFIIDTGVELTHSDIVNNLWVNPGEIAANGIDDDGNGFVDDVNGWNFMHDNNDVSDVYHHGIHVNGIVGAEGDNANKVAGINWHCKLAQGKIFDPDGTWEAGAAATTYAADNGGRVTNNSWGDTVPGPQVYVDAIAYADSLDLLQVAAAGNQGDTNLFWPAAYAEFVSVASTDSGDALSWFSSHGSWIDMAAPGESVWNLWIGDSATYLSGTSMASPHVCGAGALLRTVNPQLSNLEARVTLRLMSDDIGTLGYDDSFGFGRLDIKKALDAAASIGLSTRDVNRPGSVDVTLAQAGEANMTYILLASMSGIVPGAVLSGFDPTDGRTVPIDFDVLTAFELAVQPNPILAGSIGTLDGSGGATATFHVPGGPLFKDKTISFCYVTFDPADSSKVRFISAPTSFRVH
jgi:subtilisin family serine protease